MEKKQTLTIALIQADLLWEDPEGNRAIFEKKIQELPTATDLVILPEMFTTGFTMNAATVAETMEGDTLVWMKKLAETHQMAVTGSVVIKEGEAENERYFNRLLFVYPDGKIVKYDKRHTFTLAGEHTVYASGTEKIHIEFKGWSICPLICYDLRFPVWARNTEDYDLLFYVASWPKPRIGAWDALLKARAIENMSYTIGVNRVGEDINGHAYTGNTVAYDALGNCLEKNDKGEEAILLVTLDKKEQSALRDKFRFLDDKDIFTL